MTYCGRLAEFLRTGRDQLWSRDEDAGVSPHPLRLIAVMGAVSAAISIRISHGPKGRQAGVERQELDCRRMAADRGWVVLEPVYRENDTSASTRSKKRRPVFEQLMQDVSAGGVDVPERSPPRRPGRCGGPGRRRCHSPFSWVPDKGGERVAKKHPWAPMRWDDPQRVDCCGRRSGRPRCGNSVDHGEGGDEHHRAPRGGRCARHRGVDTRASGGLNP